MPYSSIAKTRVTVIHDRIPKSVKWDKFDGGDLSHSNSRFFVDPSEPEVVWPGKSQRDNITTEAHVDPVAHDGFIQALNAGDKFENAVIRVQSLDSAGLPVGNPDVYKGCLVAKYTPRKVDLNSEDMQKLPIEWEVPSP